MRVPIFHLDAFTSRAFAGNPAAVMLLERFPDDGLLQRIAAENNLSETAFLVREGNDDRDHNRNDYRLRWFTPKTEVPLCGHATLASAAVVMERLERGRDVVVFHSLSGPLTVTRAETGFLMNFPARPSQLVSTPRALAEALGAEPIEVFSNEFNYLAVFGSEREVRELRPDMEALARIGRPGVIVTAPSLEKHYDFI
jgi:PhzF family phenazine biosynthesis protein